MSEGSRKQFIGLSLFLEKTMRLSDCYVCYRNFMFIIKTENGSNENNKTNVMLLLRTWNKIIHLHLLKIVTQATLDSYMNLLIRMFT